MTAARFTDDQVRHIRTEYTRDETLTLNDLAKKYACDNRTIAHLLNGTTYGRIPGAVTVRNPLGGGAKRSTPMWKIDRVKELHRLGWKGSQIARELGITSSHVYSILKGNYDYLRA